MLAARESENRQQQEKTVTLTFSFFFSSPKKGCWFGAKEKRKNKHKRMGAKEKRGKKNKKTLPFAGNRKKKAATSFPANVCSFLVLTKMTKQKTFAFGC